MTLGIYLLDSYPQMIDKKPLLERFFSFSLRHREDRFVSCGIQIKKK